MVRVPSISNIHNPLNRGGDGGIREVGTGNWEGGGDWIGVGDGNDCMEVECGDCIEVGCGDDCMEEYECCDLEFMGRIVNLPRFMNHTIMHINNKAVIKINQHFFIYIIVI